MSDAVNYIMLNGSCIAEEEAVIPVVSSGLYYGAGCFETFLAENGMIFKFDDHVKRLNSGLNYLGVSEREIISRESILSQIRELLEKNDFLNKRTRIRIQVSLAEKGGYSLNDDSSINAVITTQLAEKKTGPNKLILSETSVAPSSVRPSKLKLSNMLHYRQAYREAEQKGADDALMITSNGFVAESSIANIFWVKGETIFTPSENCDILPGIMRNSIIEILKKKLKHKINEGRFSMDVLLKADLVWLTNSVIEIIPVSDIEKVSFRINDQFFSVLRDELKDFKKEYSTYV